MNGNAHGMYLKLNQYTTFTKVYSKPTNANIRILINWVWWLLLGNEGSETRNRKNHSTNRSSSRTSPEEEKTEPAAPEYTTEQAESVRR